MTQAHRHLHSAIYPNSRRPRRCRPVVRPRPASASRSVAKALRGRRLYDIYDIYGKDLCEKIWRQDAKNLKSQNVTKSQYYRRKITILQTLSP